MQDSDQMQETLGTAPKTIAVVSPSDRHRKAVLTALEQFPDTRVREYVTYPTDVESAGEVLKREFNIVIVELDSYPEYALQLVSNVSNGGAASVIVFSAQPSPDLLLRCMRAGAREFLPLPISASEMKEALVRVSSRRLEIPLAPQAAPDPPAQGKMLVLMSAKGGVGVTTIACSLGVSLAQEFSKRTLLIDLNFPLGDAALNLGLKNQYSTIDAIGNIQRLDGSLLTSLLVQHESGLFVLPAPSELSMVRITSDAIFKLLRIARQEFEFVIVDAGSRPDVQNTLAFDSSVTVYLVTQVGIPELRNSNRLIRQLQVEGGPKLEIVINRSGTDSAGIEDDQVTKALTKAPDWKIPNDYAAVRRMQNLGTPVVEDDTEIAAAIRRIGKSLTGQTVAVKKKKLFGIF